MTIRDVPDGTRDVLAARASRAGQSLQEYLRSLLVETASRSTTQEWVDRVRDGVRRDGGTRMSGDELVALVHEARQGR